MKLYKSRMLNEIKKIFPQQLNPIVSGFGNQKSDAIAYISAGIDKDRIFFIKDQKLYQMSGKYSFSFTSLLKHINKLYPDVDNFII